jgi:hypothetical protein
MKLRTKVIVATQEQLATARTPTLVVGMRPGTVLLKFATIEDRQTTLRRHKGMAGTNLGLG